jgi:hypothetical protein
MNKLVSDTLRKVKSAKKCHILIKLFHKTKENEIIGVFVPYSRCKDENKGQF